MTLQAPQVVGGVAAASPDFVESLTACVVTLVEPRKVRPMIRMTSSEIPIVTLKWEEERIRTPHFQKPVHSRTRAYTQKADQCAVYQEKIPPSIIVKVVGE